MVSSVRVVAVLVLLAFSLWGEASADKAVAADAYKRGMAAYALDDWDAAISQFEKGFREEPRPEFLFNIAQSHRQAGRHEQAIRFYQRYLDLKPGAPDRADVERVIATLRESVAAKQRAKVATPASIEGARVTPGDAVEHARAPARVDGSRANGLGVGLLAGGAAVAAVGIGLAVYGSIAAGKATDLTTSIDLGERDSLLSRSNATSLSGYAAVGLGAALMAGGAVSLARRPKQAFSLGVALSPDHIACSVGGRF